MKVPGMGFKQLELRPCKNVMFFKQSGFFKRRRGCRGGVTAKKAAAAGAVVRNAKRGHLILVGRQSPLLAFTSD